ncbi:MAG: nucleotide exchange factor GrpE [Candidatus Wildermuthbacteria bacterium]|nr:nucleotide exchange factor GrpE [Candidatus Wildermuthbacteria bacterium]
MNKETPPDAEPSAGESAGSVESQSLKEKLGALEKETAEYLAGWQRAKADLLNYKKEERERLEKMVAYANESCVLNLLPVLDNLERAEQGIPEEQAKDPVTQGFMQIAKQLREFLKNQGAEEIHALGEQFNPALHEAVGETEGLPEQSGRVAQVVEKGYRIKERVLRAAKVKVGITGNQ